MSQGLPQWWTCASGRCVGVGASSSTPEESICTCSEMVLRDETVSCFKLVVEKESILKCLWKCTSVHVQSSFFSLRTVEQI